MRHRDKPQVPERSETEIKRDVLDTLQSVFRAPGSWFHRNNSGGRVRRMGIVGLGKGSADIIGCVALRIGRALIGISIGVEVKRPGEELDPDQITWKEMHEAAGGIFVMATSAQEAVDLVQAALNERIRLAA